MKPRIIAVLGMHRSGTSAIARSLKALGVDLGDNLFGPIAGDNDKGFWEDADLQKFNERLLAKLGSGWNRISPIDAGRLVQDEFKSERFEASTLLERKFADAPVFGFKDPRTSVLLPFWRCIFDDLGVDHQYIIALRNPLEVAESLRKRDRLELSHALALWLKYSWASIEHSAGQRRICVSYAGMLADPAAELARIATAFDLSVPSRTSPAFTEFATDFLSPDLRRNRISVRELERAASVPKIAKELFAAMAAWSELPAGEEPALPPRLGRQIEAFWAGSRQVLELSDLFFARGLADEKRIVLAERRNDELESQLAALKQAKASVDASLKGAWDELGPLRDKYAAAGSRIAELESAAQASGGQLANEQARVEAAKIVIAGRDQQIAALQQAKGTVEASLQGAWDELGPLREKYAAAETRIEGLEAAAQEAGAKLADAYARIEAANTALAGRDEALAELRQTHQSIEASLKGAWDELGPLREKFAAAEALLAERDRELAELHKARIALDASLQEAVGELGPLREMYAAASTRNAELEAAVAEAGASLSDALARIGAANSEIAARDQKLAEAHKAREALEASLKGAWDELGALREAHASAEARIAQLEGEKTSLEADFSGKIKELRLMRSELTLKLEEANAAAAATASAHDARVSALQASLAEREGQVRRQEEDLAREGERLKAQSAQLAAAEAEQLRLQDELAAAKERSMQLQTSLQETTRNLRLTRSEILSLTTEIQLANEQRTSDLAEFESELSNLRSSLAAAHDALQEKDGAEAHLQEHISDLSHNNYLAVQAIEQLKEQVHALHTSTSWKITKPLRGLARLLTFR